MYHRVAGSSERFVQPSRSQLERDERDPGHPSEIIKSILHGYWEAKVSRANFSFLSKGMTMESRVEYRGLGGCNRAKSR